MYKRTFHTVLLLTVLGTAVIAQNIDLKKFKPLGVKSVPVKFDGSFDNQVKDWKLGYGYKVLPGSGRNGTAALTYERKNFKHYALASKTVKLIPGNSYSVALWIKTENIKNVKKPADSNYGALCMEFSKDGKWYGGVYPKTRGEYADWTKKKFKFTAKSGMTSAKIVLYMRKGFAGKIWFDDVTIEPAGRLNASIALLRPTANFFGAESGDVKFKTITFLPSGYKNYKLALHLKAAQGRQKQEALLPLNESGVASGTLSKLKNGKLVIDASLLDLKNKKLLHEKKFTTLVKLNSERPVGTCIIDKYGRALIDNKPFLPIGLFTGNASETDIKLMASASFNCVLPYSSFSLNAAGGKGSNRINKLKKALDVYHKHGMKVIFSLKDQYPGMRYANYSLDETKGVMKVTEKVVSNLREHPAILSWYVCDEAIRAFFPDVEALRDRVSMLDPNHPVYSLTFRLDDFPYFGSTGDIMGVDTYPVYNNKSNSMQKVSVAMDAGIQTGKPIWFVGQVFNWGTVKALNKGKKEYGKFRAPSAEEMRSMALLAAIKGAKGFIFYSFHDLRRAERFEPGSFKRRWPQIAELAGLLKSLESFILSIKKAPRVTVEMLSGDKGQVQARAFVDKNGKVMIMVSGNGPGENKAEITIKSNVELKSKYGRCHRVGKGKYLFCGDNICSDILYN